MKQNYLKGKENWFIRQWFYLQRGMALWRNFKEPIAGVIALYAVLKITDPMWMIWTFLGIMPIFVISGYYDVHVIAKVIEWLSVKFSTVYQKKNFENTEKTVTLLHKIHDTLRTKSPPTKEKHTKVVKRRKSRKSITIKG